MSREKNGVSYFLNRRHFLKIGAAASGMASFCGFRAWGAEDVGELYRKVVPEDKALPSDWVESLVRRGHPMDAAIRSRRAEDLPHIGMTVGGIGCGTVYLSGDGRLYVWDIFNQEHEGVVPTNNNAKPSSGITQMDNPPRKLRERDGANYVCPPSLRSHPNPFVQECRVVVDGNTRPLDLRGFKEVEFEGRWPIGQVRLSDPSCSIRVELKAWTPFVPLSVRESAIPTTILEYRIKNTSAERVTGSFESLLENPCLAYSRKKWPVRLRSVTKKMGEDLVLYHGLASEEPGESDRPDIPFEDFESTDYEGWSVEGTAFGTGPIRRDAVPKYQEDLNMHGAGAVNSHATAPGSGVHEKDQATGALLSREVVIPRRFLALRIGGGNHPGETGIEVLVDGKAVASGTGENRNRMERIVLDLSAFEGKSARIHIFDKATGGWGNIGVDELVFTDTSKTSSELEQESDFGTMAMALAGSASRMEEREGIPALVADFSLDAGAEQTMEVVLAWHFPWTVRLAALGRRKRHVAAWYPDATGVMAEVLEKRETLRERTFAWERTWNDSTLPQWLLDRAILTSNTLQTQNCILLEDGRFWAWEGVNCCPGTCAHVWHYAQGPARLFPDLERNLRSVTDFDIAMNKDGGIHFRAESNQGVAIDGQAGVVLRTWREHLMSPDDDFLKSVWPSCRRAIQWLIRFDNHGRGGLDGLLDGRQHNTLDADWYGKVHCLCSLYLASLHAGYRMAERVGDAEFAAECRRVAELGSQNIRKLFNGEFFEQEEDPAHSSAIGVGRGCYIDQVIGQWWAWNVHLGRIHDADMAHSALHALWRYNYLVDVGPFRNAFREGRFYALPGEGGLLMCTWPRGGLRSDFKKH